LDETRLGELAALGTAVLWTTSAAAFETAGRKVGSVAVNVIRLSIAFAFLLVHGLATSGSLLPFDAPHDAWVLFAASGIAGFVLCDLCLFRAFVLIGARLSLLVMALTPPLTALLGYAFLGEGLTGLQLGGMGLTLAGVSVAVLGQRGEQTSSRRRLFAGLALAGTGAIGHAAGLLLSRAGMALHGDAFDGTRIRALAGLAGMAVIYTVAGWWPRVVPAVKDRRILGILAGGAFAGPFLGVVLSLVAVGLAKTGVASTLMSVTPILILPWAVFVRKEHVGAKAIAGAVLAVAGVSLLFA
jgi:drug/metabolite transporter (DMT)-like permease